MLRRIDDYVWAEGDDDGEECWEELDTSTLTLEPNEADGEPEAKQPRVFKKEPKWN